MATKTDTDITADVLAELAWDPSVTIADLDVAASSGYVTLSGIAATHRAKDAAYDAAYRVYGVRGVTSEIAVDPTLLGLRSDAAIQADVRSALTMDTIVPLDRVGIAVYDGLATLTGTLDHYYQRAAAADDARRIAGVVGVDDLIVVAPPGPLAVDVADHIARAFARNAELADDNVSVAVAGSTVTLGGTVRTWSESEAAASAAWRASGVSAVVNNILVTY